MAKSKFWTSDRIVSFSAMFISLMTLFIFIKQTNIIEKQSKLSAMPYLSINISNNSVTKLVTIDLVNHGLGPALIEGVETSYNGKTTNLQLREFLVENFAAMDSIEVISTSDIDKGLAIPAEDEVNLITAGGTEVGYTSFVEILEVLSSEKFDYNITYKSIYNDKWVINGKLEEPKKLN